MHEFKPSCLILDMHFRILDDVLIIYVLHKRCMVQRNFFVLSAAVSKRSHPPLLKLGFGVCSAVSNVIGRGVATNGEVLCFMSSSSCLLLFIPSFLFLPYCDLCVFKIVNSLLDRWHCFQYLASVRALREKYAITLKMARKRICEYVQTLRSLIV
jgi:hypothetical protein